MSKYEYVNEYNRNNYYKVALRIPIEKKAELQELANEMDMTINKLIIKAIEKQYGITLTIKKSKLTDSK